MFSILVAFPKNEDANTIKNALVSNGIEVAGVTNTGAQTIAFAGELDGGIVISAYRMRDMHFRELNAYLPRGFKLVLIASPARLAECMDDDIITLNTPLHVKELLGTVQMMQQAAQRREKKDKEKEARIRSNGDKDTILHAKLLLMERNNLSEEEAYRYIQKTSMDSGTNMTEVAEMILCMM